MGKLLATTSGLAFGAFTAMMASCSADPSLLTDGRGGDPRRMQSANEPAPNGASPMGGMPSGATSGDGGAPSADAAARADARADAAGADAAPGITAFTGAGAFVATTGPSARKDTHAFAGNTPPTSPSKQPCLDCHVAGGAATPFALGGTVFKDVAGTVPAPGVEVRVRAADGGATSVYSDEDGNFYQPLAFPFPANTGIRNAASARTMMAAPPDGNCNAPQCHGGGAHPPVNLP